MKKTEEMTIPGKEFRFYKSSVVPDEIPNDDP
jgi:hypothetical protein